MRETMLAQKALQGIENESWELQWGSKEKKYCSHNRSLICPPLQANSKQIMIFRPSNLPPQYLKACAFPYIVVRLSTTNRSQIMSIFLLLKVCVAYL